MKSVAFLLVAVLAVSCAAAERPQSVVDAFYSAHLPHRTGGLPSGDELRRLQPFLSQRLHGLITAALAYQEDWVKRNPPDEKPPFVDGDYFSSVFEGPGSFKVSRVVKEQDGWHVHVRFKYEPAPDWEDVVVVKQENGRYVIDDVLFSGVGEFNPPGRLSERLKPMP